MNDDKRTESVKDNCYATTTEQLKPVVITHLIIIYIHCDWVCHSHNLLFTQITNKIWDINVNATEHSAHSTIQVLRTC